VQARTVNARTGERAERGGHSLPRSRERARSRTGEAAQVSARAERDVLLPVRVGYLLSAAVEAARAVEGRWMCPGECLARIAWHFVETWRPVLDARVTRHQRALLREHGRCQVPGCSRAADHAHHVELRSRGGPDTFENLAGVCAPHHLVGIHGGFVRVDGRAPDGLRWELGVRAGAPPLAVFCASA
jgi:hypothetical protein